MATEQNSHRIHLLFRNYISVIILLIVCGFPHIVVAQQRTGMTGVITDAETGETLPFVQIYFVKQDGKTIVPTTVGTTSDIDGNFSLYNSEGYTMVNFQMMGYKTAVYTLRNGQTRKNIKIRMEPDVYGLQDVVVKPTKQKQKYKRKGNPAVELIREVIAHKDSLCAKTADYYTADTYSRMSFALDNFHPDFKKGIWKNFAFAEKYIDTTSEYHSLTVSIREHLSQEYYQRKPRKEKRILQKKRIFGIEDIVDSRTFHENVNAIFKDIDINNDNMNLLFNRFVSPLSSNLAVAYYQYYIMDTIMVEGEECIDLAFVPVNSESYSFTGHLYIINDSTYKIKKYAMNIPKNINLNFVSDYSIEHSYKKLDNGLWSPDRTTTYAKFYIMNRKRGIVARQTKLYTDWDFLTPIPKEIFSAMIAEEVETNDSTAVRIASKEWGELRPEPLTEYENSVVDLVNEFTSTPTFNSLALFVNAVTTEYIPTMPAARMNESKFDIGPIYNFLSWNMLEGVRLRFGGTTTAKLNDQFFLRGYVAFGTKDLRPKYNASLVYTFDHRRKHPFDGIRHYLQLSAQYDVEVPGQITDVIRRDHILMSIPTSKPTLGFNQYVFHANVEYMKEWQNRLSVRANFDFSNNEAAGAMRYNRVDYTFNTDGTYNRTLTDIVSYRNYETMVELQYSPDSRTYMDRWGKESSFSMDKDVPTLRLTHYSGYLDDRHNGGVGFVYNRTEMMYEQRFWFSSFGHLDLRAQAGIIWQQVPFTKLYIPQSSTSIFLAQRAFNQMNPMEFMMDQYIALYATYYFKGWVINRIPYINRLKLRGVVSFSGIYGGLTKKNNPYLSDNSGLYDFPQTATFDKDGYYQSGRLSSPIGKLPYMELTAGIENIFRFIRIDYIRRLTYNDYELPYQVPRLDELGNTLFDENGEPLLINARRKVGAWGRNGVKITVRFTL